MENKIEDIKIKDVIKDGIAKFHYMQNRVMWYKIENEKDVYIFPVDLNNTEDIGEARFEPEYKAITLMRYLRKAIIDKTIASYKK